MIPELVFTISGIPTRSSGPTSTALPPSRTSGKRSPLGLFAILNIKLLKRGLEKKDSTLGLYRRLERRSFRRQSQP